MNKKKIGIVWVFVLTVLVGGGGFALGMWYQKSQSPFSRNFNSRLGENGTRRQFPTGQNGGTRTFGAGGTVRRPVSGTISSVDSDGITVALPDGGSKVVTVGKDVRISIAEKGAADDLKKGKQVTIIGSENTEGVVNAQSIILGDAVFMMGGQVRGK